MKTKTTLPCRLRSIGILAMVIGLGILLPTTASAQFGKKLLNRTKEKLENQAVEEISNTLVSMAMRPIRKSTNAMLKKKYKDKYGKDFDEDDYENDEDMQKALYNSLSDFYAVELPAEYVLLYELDYEVESDEGKEEYTMMLNPEEQLFAIRSQEKGSTAIMLFDYGNDIMATYDMEKMEVLAFQHAMKTAGAWNNANTQYEPVESTSVTITPIDKKKKIAKCSCNGMKYASEDSEGEVYFCKDLPFDWKDMYGGMIQQIAPGEYNRYPGKDFSGVPFYVESKDLEDNSESTMKVKKWQKRTTVIHNGDFVNQFEAG